MDTKEITAQRIPTEGGAATVELTKDIINDIDIVLSDDKEIYGEATLQIDEVKQLLLSSDFNSLNMRMLNSNDNSIKIKKLLFIELFDSIGDSLGDITGMFKLNKDGSISASSLTELKTLFMSKPNKLTLTVTAVDSKGLPYSNDVSFYMAKNQVSGILVPPPSFPELNVSNIQITGKILNTGIVVSTLSDANGYFAFPELPNGNLEITSQTLQNGSYYYGNGVFSLTEAADLTVNMVTTMDLSGNNIQSVINQKGSIKPSFSSSMSNIIGINARRPEDLKKSKSIKQNETLNINPLAVNTADSVPTSVSVNVVAGTQDIPSKQNNKLTLSKGTKNVTLTYNVATDEYPEYVTQQSIYNDLWNISVFAGNQGKQLVTITRQVNSQLTQQPIWLSNGTTGDIKEVFDVSTLAKDNDVELTLSASATNISDSILPTSVSATVVLGAGLTINKVTAKPDEWVVFLYS